MCFTRSHGFRALGLAFANGDVVFSVATFREFEEVALRPRFDRFIPLQLRTQLVAAMRRRAIFGSAWSQYRACRDPNDDKFLDIAVSAAAAAIVTRDQDLLSLDSFNGISIVEPIEFNARLAA